ncbi:MAG: DUF2461 domain-containing protein [Bacteroidota bacterium]|nr:DUF2461 domain-containing protein [Bacteroidota bacterium]
MEEILEFLTDLRQNNNREWFHSNKSEYKNAQSKFNLIAERFLKDISTFDNSVKHLTLKECTYRIYRDLRFSKDKTPYKTHFGVYVCQGGKKSWDAGYYFHIEPKWEDGTGGHKLYCGSFMPDKDRLQLIREDVFNNGKLYRQAIQEAKNFYLEENSLKKNPKGFPESEFDDLIRMKSFILVQDITKNQLLSKDLNEYLKQESKVGYPLIKMLNEATSFVGNY